jgi:GH25 family lysozyme M1 (1,4-beta-N-acetylmuramidase)/alpha-tubulin suppressor-like RCC1 family protein
VGSQVTCVTGRETACAGRGIFQIPADLGALTEAVALVFGLRHGCLLDRDHHVRCWGDALDGQLGVPAAAVTQRHLGRPARAEAAPVPGAPELVELTAGWLHTCGSTRAGGVVCWGDNARGQLGRGGDAPEAAPVPGLEGGVHALSAGGLHTCAIDAGGAVRCWGDGSLGQLGAGDGGDSATPSAVLGLSAPASEVAAGAYHSCARLADGAVECWGDNRFGQLGDGTRERRRQATPVRGLAGPARAVVAGASFSCALLEDGRVQCWGSNEFGELGAGIAERELAAPGGLDAFASAGAFVAGLPGEVETLRAAEIHACARTVAGDIECWGGNESGQLGDGTVATRPAPVAWRGDGPEFPRPATAALTSPVEGIDVSYHSGRVDWAAAHAAGYRFGLMLATAGVDFRDPFLAAHWESIRQAGLVRGAYHFFVAADDPAAQAHHFLSHVVLEPGDLPPVVDIESATDQAPADLTARLETFLAEIEAAIGVKPIIYTSPVFWRDRVRDHDLGGYPLWIAEYQVDQPIVPAGWSQWHVWQWRDNAELPHIAPVVDLNRLHPGVDLARFLIPAGGARHAAP